MKRKLNGWKEITTYAGWSESQLRKLETLGLRIHRDRQGGKNIVWANPKEIDQFLRDWQDGNIEPTLNTVQSLTDSQGSHLWNGGTAAFAVAILLSLLLFLQWDHKTPGPPFVPPKIIDQTETDPVEPYLIKKVFLHSDNAQQPKLIWDHDKGYLGKLGAYLYNNNHAISPGTIEREPLYFKGFGSTYGDDKLIESFQDTRPIGFLPLSVVSSEDGTRFPDMNLIVASEWIDSQVFQGWAIAIASANDHASCLVFFDSKFQEIARLYHPGRYSDMTHIDQALYISATCNARERPQDQYFTVFFKIDLYKVLTKGCSQLLPFSEKTIPSADRRAYYKLRDTVIVKPVVAFFMRHE
jgi:hypothetical protein